MKLPFLNKKPKVEYFLALVLRDDKINAFVIEQEQNAIKIVNSQEEAFSDSLDKTSYEDLLDAADKVISQAEDELDLPLEVQKTIFGLKESWVKDAKIKPEYLEILKKLSNALGLTPVGFLTVNESVVSLLQKEEGAPPSAIFVDVGKNNVTVASVRAGKVVETKTAEIHQSPVFTVDTLLKHFEVVEILPAKVVLLNEDEDLVQEFIGHQWSKSLPFLHLPQIVSLQMDSIGKAFAIGLANQMGAEVQTEFEPSPPASASEDKGATAGGEKIEQKEEIVEPTEPVQKPEELQSNIKIVDTTDFFGFTDKDVAKEEPPKIEVAKEPQVFEEVPEEVALKETQNQLLPAAALVLLPKIRDFIAELFTRLKGLNFKGLRIPNTPFGRGPLLFAIIPIALILLFAIYYLFFLKATIVLSITTKVVEKTADITFSDSSDFKNNTIKGDLITQSEDGDTSMDTTGKKEIGDKAKGTVTIKNYSQQKSYSLPAKTTITSSNNLNFLTLGDVTIASRSGDIISSKNVDVEAEKFGTEYNIPSKTDFTIAGNSDLTIKNDNPFSGGTKKEIQVVSKDDVLKLSDNLIKNLEDKAKTDIKGKLTGDKDILADFVDESLLKKSLDKDVDSEATSVKLTGTVSYQALAYDKQELVNFLKTIFASDQTIDKNNIELKFENVKKKGDTVTTHMTAKVKISPKIDTDILAKRLAGKSFSEARTEILANKQINDVEIRFSSNLGFLPKVLPRNSKNIRINISEND